MPFNPCLLLYSLAQVWMTLSPPFGTCLYRQNCSLFAKIDKTNALRDDMNFYSWNYSGKNISLLWFSNKMKHRPIWRDGDRFQYALWAPLLLNCSEIQKCKFVHCATVWPRLHCLSLESAARRVKFPTIMMQPTWFIIFYYFFKWVVGLY